MRHPEQYAAEYTASHQKLLTAAFYRFAETNIDSVSLSTIAADAGLTVRTLFRHFDGKGALVVESATWAWKSFLTQNRARRQTQETATAAEDYAFFLDSFLNLYRNHRDILRFNHFFNVYVQSAQIDSEQLRPYQAMVGALRDWFAATYEKGKRDGTLRTDFDEEAMFSISLHIMLAAVTRYSVGLVYRDTSNLDEELMFLENLLIQRFTK